MLSFSLVTFKKIRATPLLWVVPVLTLSLSCFAAPASDTMPTTARDGVAIGPAIEGIAERPERKRPSFWRRRASHDSPADQMQAARRAEERQDWRRAARLYEALVRTWSDAPEAVKAQERLARTFEKRRKYAKAFDEYLYLLHYYGDKIATMEPLSRMFAIANHYRGKNSRDRARRMFSTIAELAPQWSRTPEALIWVARLHREQKNLPEAALAYDRVVQEHANSAQAPVAAAEAAFCRYRLALRYANDESMALSALSSFAVAMGRQQPPELREKLRQAYDDLLERRAERHYRAAAFYDSRRYPAHAAITAYRDFLRRFPETSQAEIVRKRLHKLTSGMQD